MTTVRETSKNTLLLGTTGRQEINRNVVNQSDVYFAFSWINWHISVMITLDPRNLISPRYFSTCSSCCTTWLHHYRRCQSRFFPMFRSVDCVFVIVHPFYFHLFVQACTSERFKSARRLQQKLHLLSSHADTTLLKFIKQEWKISPYHLWKVCSTFVVPHSDYWVCLQTI